jgi:hypothetical protein
VQRLATRRFIARDPDGRRVGIYETERAASRALPAVTTTTTKPKPAQRGRAGLDDQRKGAPGCLAD